MMSTGKTATLKKFLGITIHVVQDILNSSLQVTDKIGDIGTCMVVESYIHTNVFDSPACKCCITLQGRVEI